MGLPGLPPFPDIFGGVPLPAFSGVRLTTSAKGWIPVPYRDPIEGKALTFRSPPVVFAIYEARTGWPPPERVTIPPPTLPKVAGIPQISGITIPNPPAIQGVSIPGVSIPRVSIPWPVQVYDSGTDEGGPGYVSIETFARRVAKRAMRAIMGDWGYTMNWARDSIVAAGGELAFRVVGGTLNVVVAEAVKGINSGLDKATGAVNQGLASATSQVNAGLGRVTTAINTGLRNATDQVNIGLGRVTGGINQGLGNVNASLETYQKSVSDVLASAARSVENAINDVAPQLWKLLGLDQGVVGSLAAIRNAGQASVEVFSPGGGAPGTGGSPTTVVHVFAMGARA